MCPVSGAGGGVAGGFGTGVMLGLVVGGAEHQARPVAKDLSVSITVSLCRCCYSMNSVFYKCFILDIQCQFFSSPSMPGLEQKGKSFDTS